MADAQQLYRCSIVLVALLVVNNVLLYSELINRYFENKKGGVLETVCTLEAHQPDFHLKPRG